MKPAIESIDLGAFLAGSAEQQMSTGLQVDDICRSTGFLMVENHGVDEALIGTTWAAAAEFFALPIEEKSKARSEDPECPRGYFPQQSEALAGSRGVETPPDLKEAFSIGPLRAPDCAMSRTDYEFHYGENLWPAAPAGFRDTLTAYYRAMEQLGGRVLMLLAQALSLPKDYFVQYHTHHISALRALCYPAAASAPQPEQLGAGEHSDYGAVTILKPDPEVPGLQIRLPCGDWVEAPLVKDAFIVNIGDMMARWTNDRWVSTMHRVAAPADTGVCRQSLAYFLNPNFDAEISCIPTCRKSGEPARYRSVLAGQYLMRRFLSALG